MHIFTRVRRLFGDKESEANIFRGISSVFKSTPPKTATDLSQLNTYDEGKVWPMFTMKLLIKYGLDVSICVSKYGR
jgi:hypothetical protein